jgi:hypothetical protein
VRPLPDRRADEVYERPVLANLAAATDCADAGDSPLLQALSVPENPAVALVCVPYEAGNALNFGAMAPVLSTSDVPVYAVELPGHDVARSHAAAAADLITATIATTGGGFR